MDLTNTYIDLSTSRKLPRLSGSVLPQCILDQAAADIGRGTEAQTRVAQPPALPRTIVVHERLRIGLLNLTDPDCSDRSARDDQLRNEPQQHKIESSRPSSPFGFLGQIVEEMASDL